MSKSSVSMGRGLPKSSLFDLSHTNNTSSDFGFLQPIYGRELHDSDNITININDFVRLAPMPQPTFAKGVKYKKFGMFIPYEDVYKPFANFITQKPYSPAEGTRYIPSRVPYSTIQYLTALILRDYCEYFVYEVQGSSSAIAFDYNLLTRSFAQDAEEAFIEYINGILNMPNMGYGDFKSRVAFDTSFNPADADLLVRFVDDAGDQIAIAFRLTRKGRNIRKVLIGLGYQLDLTNTTEVSLLPIYCFAKAYFDIFFPQRYITWTDTDTYAMLNTMMQNNVVGLQAYSIEFGFDAIYKVFEELACSFYTYNVDYFSAQLGNNSLEQTETRIDSVDNGVNDYETSSAFSGPDYTPYAGSSSATPDITAMQVWLVERLTKFVNKNTIVGGKIHEWLAAHGLGKYIDDHRTNFLGSSETSIQVFDVDSNAGTESTKLGQYAGKGIGSGHSEFRYKANCAGHLIIMACIVPEVGYYQGVNPMLHHTQPMEYFKPEFDALGLVSTYKGDMISNDMVSPDNVVNPGLPFGLIPRYSEYKCQPLDIVNGNVSLPSTRPYLMGYHLNRHIQQSYITAQPSEFEGKFEVTEHNPIDNIANSINWRFCNRYEWMGNFNRIFYNSYHIAKFNDFWDDDEFAMDNFIIHHFIDVKLHSQMLPMSHSYMTDALDNDAISVEKN